jgi:hypothetical protein
MQSHEHSMTDAIKSRESTLGLLFDATAGFEHADRDIKCCHCDQLVTADTYGTWTHVESCDSPCTDDEDSTFAAPSADDVAALESVGVDVDDVLESAQSAIDNYALEVSARTVLDVLLSYGGPTVRMSAPIERDQYGSWERTGTVEFVDSWAVPSETSLSDDSMLTTLFDRYVETYQPADD